MGANCHPPSYRNYGKRIIKTEIIATLQKSFEDYAHIVDGIEFWYAQDLQILLDYSKWENFHLVIQKAKWACKNSQQIIMDHFPEIRKMIAMPKRVTKEIEVSL